MHLNITKGVFKGGGVQTPTPPRRDFQLFFWKSAGKEVERKRNEKGCRGPVGG